MNRGGKRRYTAWAGIILAAGMLAAIGCSEAPPGPPDLPTDQIPAPISQAMALQQDAWNRGDIVGFMEAAYWKSDSLIFIGSSGVTRGFDATLEKYAQSYPDRGAMGDLAFENLQWLPIGTEHGLLLGRWTLFRTTDTLSGHYTLSWRLNSQGRWEIFLDHTS